MPEPELLHHAGAEILQDHVGPARELAERFLAARRVDVEREAQFVPVEGAEVVAVAFAGGETELAEGVALPGALHFYDGGAEVGELQPRVRPCDELPKLDSKLHNGWRLASQEKIQSPKEVKDLASDAKKLFAKLIQEHPGTPWELLAKRDRQTALGLEWQATRIQK